MDGYAFVDSNSSADVGATESTGGRVTGGYLYQAFSELQIAITPKMIRDMDDLVIMYEIRDMHVEALGGPLLGIYPMGFSDTDRSAFFHLFGQDEKHLKSLIAKFPTFNVNYNVSSDSMALLAFWIIHLAPTYIRDKRQCETFRMSVAKYLHYRWFASLVNHYFPHKANKEVMQATINSLSRRFEIVELETWQRVLEKRCEDLLSPNGIRAKTIRQMNDDREIIAMLNDTQIRVKERVQNVASVYYEFVKDPDRRVIGRAAVSEIDGEKILSQATSVFEVMSSGIAVEIQNVHSFINDVDIRRVSKMFRSISSPEMLRHLLLGVSELASSQAATGELDVIQKKNGTTYYIGMRALVGMIVQASLHYCMQNRVSFDNKGELLLRIKEGFAASRTTDKDILDVKASVAHLVDGIVHTSREATKSSLRLALVVYIILRGFNYL